MHPLPLTRLRGTYQGDGVREAGNNKVDDALFQHKVFEWGGSISEQRYCAQNEDDKVHEYGCQAERQWAQPISKE